MRTITAPDNKHRRWMLRGIAAVVICVAADTWPHAMATATAESDPSCPYAEAVFARGTFEAPGVGDTGQAFIDALNSRLDGKNVLPAVISGPMPAAIAPHVAAVTLFGKPSNGFLDLVDRSAPPATIGKLCSAKTIELCAPGDPVCGGGLRRAAHSAYKSNGMAEQAADVAARALSSSPLLAAAQFSGDYLPSFRFSDQSRRTMWLAPASRGGRVVVRAGAELQWRIVSRQRPRGEGGER